MSDETDLPEKEDNTTPLYDDSTDPIPIRIKHRDGTISDYTIVEMEPKDFSFWMKFQTTRVKRNKQGIPDPNSVDFNQFQATLISLCLRDKEGKKLSVQKCDAFSNKLKAKLFMDCQKQNGLLEDEDSGKK